MKNIEQSKSLTGAFAALVMAREMGKYKGIKKLKLDKMMKGGTNKMDIKSRYEVIADLEEKKRTLIIERDSLGDTAIESQREIRDAKRELEDKEEELADYKKSMKQREETIKELIKSVDDSLKRLTTVSKSK